MATWPLQRTTRSSSAKARTAKWQAPMCECCAFSSRKMERGDQPAERLCRSRSKSGRLDGQSWLSSCSDRRVPLRSMRWVGLATIAAALLGVGEGGGQSGSIEQQVKDIDQQWLHAATVQDVDYLK